MRIDSADLTRMREVVGRGLGLRLTDDSDDALVAALGQRLSARSASSAQRYLERLDRTELDALGQLLVVGETYFFRMRGHFDILREIPGDLRILSAACSTGEEAYSIAMTLRGRAAVLGLDLSRRALDHAVAGVYAPWALREVTPDERERGFLGSGDRWAVRPELRSAVEFRPSNLAEETDAPFGAFDAVFCRNVLMYLTPDVAKRLVERLAASLVPGGLLFLGHAETLRGIGGAFDLESRGETFYYRLRGPIATSPPPPPPPPPPASEPSPPPVDVFALLASERFEEARAEIARLPDESATLVLRAALSLATGDVEAAEAASRRLLAMNAGVVEAHVVLALVAEHRGTRATAIEHHRAAIYFDPTFALSHLHLGRLERREGRVEAARRELTRAVDLIAYEEASRLVLFGGGFTREGLLALCRAELGAMGSRG